LGDLFRRLAIDIRYWIVEALVLTF
jgi:hypothetical protein